jgi:diacylglycerol kinase
MRRFLMGFGYAFQGIGYVVRTQRNARVHLALACLVVVAGLYLRLTTLEWAVLCLAMGFVFSAEMINTVAEVAVDMLTPRYHPMAKVAKDVGAGAVLIAALAAVGVGIAVFGPRMLALAGWR